MNSNRSAVWGGATIGLVVGLILGFFVGSYWMTVLYAVGVGAALGVIAHLLVGAGAALGVVAYLYAWVTDRWPKLPRISTADYSSDFLATLEEVLYIHPVADFETTPDAAADCAYYVWDVEEQELWRTRYDSLDSFYAAHEARHPDIRVYAAVAREVGIAEILDAAEAAQIAEPVYESVEAAEAAEDEDQWPEGLGETIVQRIAAHRAQQS